MGRDPSRSSPRELFLANLDVLRDVVDFVCRRYRLGEQEAEELDAFVKERLVETDYAALRKYRGESALRTYLSTVVHRLFFDFRNTRWGRWRPSLAAIRLGTAAVELERLLCRDGHSFDQAWRILVGEHDFRGSREELRRIADRLPKREPPTRQVELSQAPPEALAIPPHSYEPWRDESQQVVQRAFAAAFASLGAEDRMILELRFETDLSVADVSRALALPQRGLYRRVRRVLRKLRREMAARGVHRVDVKALLEAPLELALEFGPDAAEGSGGEGEGAATAEATKPPGRRRSRR
ncbi:MAG TPA: sigma-70 family RNA polymerase sigma factor [Thermoanaerobaculia bacterium]|nr:sigma-70 family RNA polymerase sigma factor [Thermoanaerobaculia bacterium]